MSRTDTRFRVFMIHILSVSLSDLVEHSLCIKFMLSQIKVSESLLIKSFNKVSVAQNDFNLPER